MAHRQRVGKLRSAMRLDGPPSRAVGFRVAAFNPPAAAVWLSADSNVRHQPMQRFNGEITELPMQNNGHAIHTLLCEPTDKASRQRRKVTDEIEM
jgi:hypothetical protein